MSMFDRVFLMAAASTAAMTIAAPAMAQSLDAQKPFDIPAQPVGDALIAFSKQSEVQVVTASADLAGVRSRPVQGLLTARQALDRLVAGGGLRWREVGPGSVAVERMGPSPASGDASTREAPPAPAPAPKPVSGTTLEDVIVTAQKREISTSKTAATVTALSGQTLEALGVKSLESLNAVVPSFQLEVTAGGNVTLGIRGVATTSAAQSLEQSVAPYIEGVYAGGHQRDFAWPLYDLERIEVFKGTQSGTVGQNTSVGVVNIVTRKPGSSFGGYLRAGYEFENDGYNVEGAVDLPVSDKLQFRLAGLHDHIGGWVKNVVTGNDLGRNNIDSLRLSARWLASDALTVRFFGQYDHANYIGPPAIGYRDPTGSYAATVSPYFTWSPGTTQTALFGARGRNGGDAGFKARSWRGAVSGDLDLGGGYTLTSTTAFENLHDHLTVDQDFLPLDINWLDQPGRYRQVHEELRLSSPQDGAFSYILGGWYRHAFTEKEITFYLKPVPGVELSAPEYFRQKIDNASGFIDAQYKVSDQITLGGSLRLTHENKRVVVDNSTGTFPIVFTQYPRTNIRLKDTFVDGSARLQYFPAEGVNLYALYAHGTKTGAVPDIVINSTITVLKPEVAETYEVGGKFSLFDRRMSLDLAVFQMDIANYQYVEVRSDAGIVNFFSQNQNLRNRGVDFSATARPAAGLTLGVGGTYLESLQKETNATATHSPRWVLNANARYDTPLGASDYKLAVFGNVTYRSFYYNHPADNVSQRNVFTPETTTLDVGAELTTPSNLHVKLLCKNCTNKHDPIERNFIGLPGNPEYAFLAVTRTITLELGVDF